MNSTHTVGLFVLLLSTQLNAEVYHFVVAGVPTYSDRADHSESAQLSPISDSVLSPPVSINGAIPSTRHSQKIAMNQINIAIDQASKLHGVEAALLHAVIQVESAYKATAISPKGASGLMQIMPATAQAYGLRNVLDITANVEVGARHLRALLDRYQGDLHLALSAYNAGDAAVKRYGGVPPFVETLRYVPAVLARLENIRRAS